MFVFILIVTTNYNISFMQWNCIHEMPVEIEYCYTVLLDATRCYAYV